MSDPVDVELGFAEEIGADETAALEDGNALDWNGGLLGGVPVVLRPGGAPPVEALTCRRCERVMPLLAQIYAPVDAHEVGHEDAYHRVLYVWACTQARCVNRPSDCPVAVGLPSVVVARGQAAADDVDMTGHRCCVCGLPATLHCARCGSAWYCSKAHQAVHWHLPPPAGHKRACVAGAPEMDLPGVLGVATEAARHGHAFRRWEIVNEHEPTAAERREAAVAALPGNAAAALRAAMAGGDSAAATTTAPAAGGAGTPLPDGSDELGDMTHFTAAELASATGAALTADAFTAYFQARVAAEPQQVLRYCRWPGLSGGAGGSAGAGAKTDGTTAAAPTGNEALWAAQRVKDTAGVGTGDEEEDDAAERDAVWGAPLWLHKLHTPEQRTDGGGGATPAAAIPPCHRCGAARRFEFQLMPQALHKLPPPAPSCGGAASGCKVPLCAPVTTEFGVIAVYTCTRSCPLGGDGFALEAAWVQPADELEAPVASAPGAAGDSEAVVAPAGPAPEGAAGAGAAGAPASGT
jgi:hypothetical protein